MKPVHPHLLFRHCFPADSALLPRIKSGVLDVARQGGWGGDNLGRLELVLEEGALNIIRYAYPEGTGEVVISLIGIEGGLLLRLEDSGIPFDPTAAPVPDLNAPAEERPIGGLGIHLLKNIADRLEYRRESGNNMLDITLLRR